MKFFRATRLFGKHSTYNRKKKTGPSRKLVGNGKIVMKPVSQLARHLARTAVVPGSGVTVIQQNGRVVLRK